MLHNFLSNKLIKTLNVFRTKLLSSSYLRETDKGQFCLEQSHQINMILKL